MGRITRNLWPALTVLAFIAWTNQCCAKTIALAFPTIADHDWEQWYKAPLPNNEANGHHIWWLICAVLSLMIILTKRLILDKTRATKGSRKAMSVVGNWMTWYTVTVCFLCCIAPSAAMETDGYSSPPRSSPLGSPVVFSAMAAAAAASAASAVFTPVPTNNSEDELEAGDSASTALVRTEKYQLARPGSTVAIPAGDCTLRRIVYWILDDLNTLHNDVTIMCEVCTSFQRLLLNDTIGTGFGIQPQLVHEIAGAFESCQTGQDYVEALTALEARLRADKNTDSLLDQLLPDVGTEVNTQLAKFNNGMTQIRQSLEERVKVLRDKANTRLADLTKKAFGSIIQTARRTLNRTARTKAKEFIAEEKTYKKQSELAQQRKVSILIVFTVRDY